MVDARLAQNSARRKRQKKLDIRVIIANPPYSSGDKNDNNNKNVEYPSLDRRISDTYVNKSSKTIGKSKIYDSYIRAIRWASDRIGDCGVVGFVTNAGFLDANTTDGLRHCLADEYSSIYVFHLRGNQRTSGELSRMEGGKIFGGGSRAPIAISILVKNPNSNRHGEIFFHDIGDYLSRESKLEKIRNFGSIAGITQADLWRRITPDEHNDWLGQRASGFEDFTVIAQKQATEQVAIFSTYSMGVKSNRDDWVYNYSRSGLKSNVKRMIEFYNAEVDRYSGRAERDVDVAEFVSRDKRDIKWTSDILADLARGRSHEFDEGDLTISQYRPFSKQWIYSNKTWNWSRHLMPRYFPNGVNGNRVICVTGLGESKGFSVFVTDVLPNLHLIAGAQCFPLYVYSQGEDDTNDGSASQLLLLDGLQEQGGSNGYARRDAITDAGLSLFQRAYPGEKILKEDMFYYVYGLLHSPDYRERYADNLSKELPRIPCVKTAADFWAFSKAGRKLADLHVNYETAEKYPLQVEGGGLLLTDADYRVEKMKYGKNGKDRDPTTLHYNHKITLTGIPLEAYEYVVNGKPALDWVVERQQVKTDNDSGIVNDANDWAVETMGNPRYPLELFQRVVTVSLETMKIVRSLPHLDIQQPGPTVGQLLEAKDEPDALTA